MTHRIRRLTSVVTVLALALALAPASALAAERRPAARTRRPQAARQRLSVAALPDTPPSVWPTDPYDGWDGTPAGARNMTPYVSYGDGSALPPASFGMPSRDEAHAFSKATNETSPGGGDYDADVDWVYFDVSAFDYAVGNPYLVEAKAGNAWVDPVVEVYGPTSSATITFTPAADCVDTISGQGTTDPLAIASSDTGYWWYPFGLSASVTFVPPAAGRYFVRVRPNFDATGRFEEPASVAGYNVFSGAGPYTLRIKTGQMTRLAGTDRVQTAVALSKERYADGELPFCDWSTGGGGSVVLASGYNFPDALSGSTLAGAVDGPLLLSHGTYLDAAVKAEIERLGATRVFLLGGPKTLSSAVESAVAGIPGVSVVRLAGSDRVQTAAMIADRSDAEYGVARLAFVANGYNFPDALAASPMAAYDVAPILLTHQAYLDKATLDAIGRLGITDVVVMGSKDAVSDVAYATLTQKLGATHVRRIGGANRYDTMKQFAVWATGSQGATDSVGTPGMPWEDKLLALYPDAFAVAAGWNYPDALGGGAFAGLAGYPLLLNPKGEGVSPYICADLGAPMPDGWSAYLTTDPDSRGYIGRIGRSYIIGGKPTLGDGVWGGLDFLIKQTIPPEF